MFYLNSGSVGRWRACRWVVGRLSVVGGLVEDLSVGWWSAVGGSMEYLSVGWWLAVGGLSVTCRLSLVL